MRIFTEINGLRRHGRQTGKTLAFVPTMGNLHAGHGECIRQAMLHADQVAVSLFVNPTQFTAQEDLANYPKTLAKDQQLLESLGVDLLFLPSVQAMYPQGTDQTSQVMAPKKLANALCGQYRHGHFDGVATVVCQLLNIVQPDLAFFGEKDWQQLQIIRRLVADLHLPVVIHSVPTAREEDGLAMSSRNGYLTPQQRQQAPHLYRVLQQVAQTMVQRKNRWSELCHQAIATLENQGFTMQYLMPTHADDLSPAWQWTGRSIRLFAAGYLGQARLIDNIAIADE